MNLRRFIFAPLTALLAISSARAADLDNPVTRGSITIQLPKGWPAGGGGGRSLLSALAPGVDQDASGKFQASFSITQDAGGPGAKLDGAQQQKVLSSQVAQYKVVEAPTGMMAGGLNGVQFGGTFKQGAVELRSRQYMFLANNQIYTITFTCLNSQWAKYAPAIEASVATLNIKR
jgi:hypothetical protein